MSIGDIPKKWAGSDDPRRRRAAYALPTLFTAGNIFLGFLSIIQSFQGALMAMAGDYGANIHFKLAALAIGWAFLLDGLDGRIARMTNTTSDFGREMDSLADVITFGLAPAVLAFAWGVQSASSLAENPVARDHLRRVGYFLSFMFLLCGAVRLARFNIQKNPVPKNPGRADRKYFVGLPIPAAAAMVGAVVYAAEGEPIVYWQLSLVWLGAIALLSFLMVSTWRYRSFKDLQLLRPRSPLIIILLGGFIYIVWTYTPAALLAMSLTYVGSGIAVRIGGALRRHLRHAPPHPEHQVG